MRFFTFFLMLSVATAGIVLGYRTITGKDLIDLADYGFGQSVQATSPTVVPRKSPTSVPSPTPIPPPTPLPTPTGVPDTTQFMAVGNTDGQGVYLRRTPRMDDRLKAWRDGSRMEVTGGIVEGDGRDWRKVRAPDGAEGYIPVEYLLPIP
ncbi:MAG: hypothetical protein ACM3US_01320 [Sphingomonadaceae bacterium]